MDCKTILDLSRFNDFFGMFAALNLAYAGSERFRDIVDTDILRLSDVERKKSETAQKLQDTISVFELSLQNAFSHRVEAFIQKYNETYAIINSRRETLENYPEGYKAMFLMSTLYCMALLIMAGYQEVMASSLFNNILFFINAAALFNIFVFVRSFTKHVATGIKPSLTILFFLIIVVISLIFYKYCKYSPTVSSLLSLEINSIIAIIISISPYLIHSIRTLCHKITFRFKYDKFLKEMADEGTTINNYVGHFINDLTRLSSDSNTNSNSNE